MSNRKKTGLYTLLLPTANEWMELEINVAKEDVTDALGTWFIGGLQVTEVCVKKQSEDLNEKMIPIKEFIRMYKIEQL